MKTLIEKHQRVAVTFLVAAFVSSCASTGGSGDDRLSRPTFYVGIGAGVSDLEPDASEVDDEVSDTEDTGFQGTLGVDISKHLSFELHYSELGSAEISPAGSIDYSVFGGSALIYAGKNRDNFKRRGLSAYGRIGVGMLDNSAEVVDFVQENETHLLLGAGVEYMTRSGIGVRGEAIAFDEDILYAQLGLIYRFGKQRQSSSASARVIDEPAAVVPPVDTELDSSQEEVTLVAPVPEADTPASAACEQLSGVLDGINFQWNSDALTAESEAVLEEVAVTLNECAEKAVRIRAHTDSQGPAEYNLNLSSRRARSVASFLIQQGVDVNRLDALAFGETQPIDSNETREGRLRNRRVELVVE